MRNMSFSLTTEQVRKRQKFVTRRLGWDSLKPGDYVQAVKKAMGLKKGEQLEKLTVIRVESVRREPLQQMIDDPLYGKAEAIREGFPDMTGAEFVAMFCEHMKVTPDYAPNRIQFVYPRASLRSRRPGEGDE